MAACLRETLTGQLRWNIPAGWSEMAVQFPTYQVLAGVGDDGWWRGGYEEFDVCYARAHRVATAPFRYGGCAA